MHRSAVIQAGVLLSSLMFWAVAPDGHAQQTRSGDKPAQAGQETAKKGANKESNKGTRKAAQKSAKKPAKKSGKVAVDHSGRVHKGKASYYGQNFYGKTMADGTPMNPNSNVAASRTLPLGTKAEVTNLENGKTEVVEIKDRGPYVDGRIIDLSPKTADKLDIREQGVAPVAVTPIEVPQPDGTVKSVNNSSGN